MIIIKILLTMKREHMPMNIQPKKIYYSSVGMMSVNIIK